MAKIRNITNQNRRWINAEVAQRALAFINSACNRDDFIDQDKSIGAAVRTLQDGLREVSSSDTVVAPSGKRITKEQAEARAGLIPESDWIDEEDCDCADRSWYGPQHDSACPLAGRDRRKVPITHHSGDVATVNLSADDWVEIYYALEDKFNSPAVQGRDSDAKRWRAHLRRILEAIGPDGKTAARASAAS